MRKITTLIPMYSDKGLWALCDDGAVLFYAAGADRWRQLPPTPQPECTGAGVAVGSSSRLTGGDGKEWLR